MRKFAKLAFCLFLIQNSIHQTQVLLGDTIVVTTQQVDTLNLSNTGGNHTLNLKQSSEPFMIQFVNPHPSSSIQSGTITIEQHLTQAKHIAWNFSGNEVVWVDADGNGIVKPDLFSDPPGSTRKINWSWDGQTYTLSEDPSNTPSQQGYDEEWTINDLTHEPEAAFRNARNIISHHDNLDGRYRIVVDQVEVQLELDVYPNGTYVFGSSGNAVKHLEIVCKNGGKFKSAMNSLDFGNQFSIVAKHFVADGVEIEGWSGDGGCIKNNGGDQNNVFIVRNCTFRNCGTLKGRYEPTFVDGEPVFDEEGNPDLNHTAFTKGCIHGTSSEGIFEVEGCEFHGCNTGHSSSDHNIYISAVHVLVSDNFCKNGGNPFKINQANTYTTQDDYAVSGAIIGNRIESEGPTTYVVRDDKYVVNPSVFQLFDRGTYNIQHNEIFGEFGSIYHTYPFEADGTFDNNTFNVNLGANFATQLSIGGAVFPSKNFIQWKNTFVPNRDFHSSYTTYDAPVFTCGPDRGFYAENSTNADFSPEGPVAVGMWVYVPSGLSASGQRLASLVDNVTDNTHYLFAVWATENGKYEVHLKTGASDTVETSVDSLPADKWCRVWFVLDSESDIRSIYIDGIREGHSTVPWEAYPSGTQRFGIGYIADSSPTFTDAAVKIAGVEFWRAIPAQEDIEYDFENPKRFMSQNPGDGVFETSLSITACKGHWQLIEGGGAIVADTLKKNHASVESLSHDWLGDTFDHSEIKDISKTGIYHAPVFTCGPDRGFYAENSTIADFSPEGPIAVGMWVYVPSGLSESGQRLASLADNATQYTRYLFAVWANKNGNYEVHLKTGWGANDTVKTSIDSLPADKWCRVWFVLDSESDIRSIYIDGIREEHSTVPWEAYPSGTQRFGIGYIANSPPAFTEAAVKIAGVEFWRAIPAREDIEYDFENPKRFMSQNPGDGVFATSLTIADCKGFWELNEGEGDFAADSLRRNDAVATDPIDLGWQGDIIDIDFRKLGN